MGKGILFFFLTLAVLIGVTAVVWRKYPNFGGQKSAEMREVGATPSPEPLNMKPEGTEDELPALDQSTESSSLESIEKDLQNTNVLDEDFSNL